jgi:beta-mannosidase
VACEDGVWWLTVSAQRFARWVHIDDHAYLPETDWFHLGPANRGASA